MTRDDFVDAIHSDKAFVEASGTFPVKSIFGALGEAEQQLKSEFGSNQEGALNEDNALKLMPLLQKTYTYARRYTFASAEASTGVSLD